MEAEDEAGLLAAEQEVQVEIDPTAAKRNERQVLLSEFGMRALTSAHILALHFLLGCFFLACRIPFNVVCNVFFREFIKGLCPAYYPHLPTFETLRTTIVDNVYEETILSTNAILDNAPGKRTLILDGKTNAVGRATCNLCDGKPGLGAYITTKYFGKREHSGRVQASYVYEQLSGQEEKYRAVVADNTGSMQVIFTLLRAWYPLMFIIGCCVHVLDLLIEDMVKLPEISRIVADFYFITVFLKRYSMLWETLLEKQQEVFGNRARKLKVFPLTRFAYAYLMISCALYNWPILRDIPEWPEYLIVQEKYPDARADFYRFESLVGNTVFKSEGQAVHGIIEPLSRMLHYLEGDSVPPSHLLPLYCFFCLYYSFVCELPLAVTTRLNNETIVGVSTMVKDRWLGRTTAPRKVGLRHDLHCLAFSLDVYVRALIVLIFGEAQLERIDRTYSDENVFAAIKNYNGGLEDAKYHRLV
ncbi:hypothetical protein CYMTET_45987 [Cymbomonas tetramitiformis]|uniref:DUF659 domain-containing protein n=1 Tax=Cymbomonas tetramitiformis TaxID=36881 RepID=A0AAE0BX37_9CHLO|nr:hypothetical protein CYMTET_45987 [Cymbomonas tetramitiformis]